MKNKVKSIVALALCLCLAGCGGKTESLSAVSDTQVSESVETYSLESIPIKSFIESYNRYSDVKFKINDAKLYSPYEAAYVSDKFVLGLTDDNNNVILTFGTSDQANLSKQFYYCVKALGTKLTDEEITNAWENTLKNGQEGYIIDVCGAYYRVQETENGTAYVFNLSYTSVTSEQEITTPKIKALLTFELVAGEQGEYGKMISRNKGTEFEDNRMAYFVPYGTYKITNIGEYMTQVNVYSDETVITEDGWEEIADSVCNDVLDVGASLTVTVPKNYHVEIGKPTHILMEQISDEVVEAETEPKVTTVAEKITSENTTIKAEKTVFITNTGKKYHSDSNCNGGDYFSVTLSEAINQGLKPCEKCIG